MSEKDTLGKVMLDIFYVCGLSEEAAIELMQTVSETMQVKNKELEIENESKMLAGHNKELQDGIIMIVKEYGLSSTEAYELINRLSDVGVKKDLVGASASMDEAVKESGTCEEPKPKYKVFANLTDEQKEEMKNVKSPVEELTIAAAKESAKIDYQSLINTVNYFVAEQLPDADLEEDGDLIIKILKEHQELTKIAESMTDENAMPFHNELIARLHKRLDCKSNKEDLLLYRSIKYSLEAAKEFREERDALKLELADIKEQSFTSGEDPGDTHEPKLDQETKDKLPFHEALIADLHKRLDCKNEPGDYRLYLAVKQIIREHRTMQGINDKLLGESKETELTQPKQTINYDALISAVAGHLDVNDWSEFNRLIKEHKELTLPMVYGMPKKAGPFGYVAPVGEPLNDKEFIVPLEPKVTPLFPPPKLTSPGELIDIDEQEKDIREWQRKAFKGKTIFFSIGMRIIHELPIDIALECGAYIAKGKEFRLPDGVRYVIRETLYTTVNELCVRVEEMKAYD